MSTGIFLGWFWASAYCCLGAGGGFCGATASGVQVRPGHAAADWRVLPAGTRVDVGGFGPVVVTDTGGAIMGHRLDVFMTDCRDAWQWGRRWVPVTLLTDWEELDTVPEEVPADAAG